MAHGAVWAPICYLCFSRSNLWRSPILSQKSIVELGQIATRTNRPNFTHVQRAGSLIWSLWGSIAHRGNRVLVVHLELLEEEEEEEEEEEDEKNKEQEKKMMMKKKKNRKCPLASSPLWPNQQLLSRGFKKVLRGGFCRSTETWFGFLSGRFGSDSGGLPGWSVTPKFWPVTLTFGPKPESFHWKFAPESFLRRSAVKPSWIHLTYHHSVECDRQTSDVDLHQPAPEFAQRGRRWDWTTVAHSLLIPWGAHTHTHNCAHSWW